MKIDLFHPIGWEKPADTASIDDLWAYYTARHRYKQRAAMLGCYLCVFAVLLVAHLSW